MAETSYKWVVKTLLEAPKLDNLENVITYVNFAYEAKKLKGKDPKGNDEFYIAQWYSGIELSKPDPKNFKPLNELTENEVLAWVTTDIKIDDIKKYVDEQIAEQKDPTNIPVPLPWDNN